MENENKIKQLIKDAKIVEERQEELLNELDGIDEIDAPELPEGYISLDEVIGSLPISLN